MPENKLSSDQAALVNTQTFWVNITSDRKPPTGVNMNLINKPSGVAQVAKYDGSPFWTHYAGLPKFND